MRWLYVVLALGLCLAAPASADDWRLTKEAKGIRVYTRMVPGSELREYHAITRFHTTLSSILTLLQDDKAASRWVQNCRRMSYLSRDAEKQEYTMWVETDLPWPISDRDAVVTTKVSQDPKTLVVTIDGKDAPDGTLVRQAGYVRMREVESSWVLMPQPGGYIEVHMRGHANPAGSVPLAIVNLLVQEIPYSTLTNMAPMLKHDKYRLARLPDVLELQDTGLAETTR